jgi:hypothetical protein
MRAARLLRDRYVRFAMARFAATTTIALALCTDCCVRLLVSETSNSVKSDAMGRDWAGERSLSWVWAYTA